VFALLAINLENQRSFRKMRGLAQRLVISLTYNASIHGVDGGRAVMKRMLGPQGSWVNQTTRASTGNATFGNHVRYYYFTTLLTEISILSTQTYCMVKV